LSSGKPPCLGCILPRRSTVPHPHRYETMSFSQGPMTIGRSGEISLSLYPRNVVLMGCLVSYLKTPPPAVSSTRSARCHVKGKPFAAAKISLPLREFPSRPVKVSSFRRVFHLPHERNCESLVKREIYPSLLGRFPQSLVAREFPPRRIFHLGSIFPLHRRLISLGSLPSYFFPLRVSLTNQ